MKILIIEDEENIASFIQRGLSEAGYEVENVSSASKALELIKNDVFDLLIIDVILPDLNGLDICKYFRKEYGYDTTVIMLTALGTTNDIVAGLDAGADDYLVKPFSFTELLARINAAFRRKNYSQSVEMLICGDLNLNYSTRRAQRQGKEIALTIKEFTLLEYMMKNQNKVLSRMNILQNVWDIDFDTNTNVVDVYVNYLRNKIDKDFNHKLIHTVVGIGYVMK